MKKRALIVLLIFIGVHFLGWAQVTEERPYWFTMERGKLYFRNGAYGEALLAFEDARNQRRNRYTRMEQDMISLLSIPEVRRLGDDLDLIEKYIADKHLINADTVLKEVYYRFPKEILFSNVSEKKAASRILEVLNQLKEYPEAEYWIGETYRAEGELGIALRQYQKAYEQRAHLEAPEFALEILYKIADIHRLRQEYNEMEKRLLEILINDTLWEQNSTTFIRAAMTKTLEDPNESDRLNRFLTLYRYNNPRVLRAHQLLGYYYYASGRYAHAAEHLLFVFLIQNSIFMDEIIRREFDYTFTTLDNLLAEVMRRPELAAYFEDIEYFKTFYYLGTAFFGDGKPAPARDFWTFLAGRENAGEWRGRAQAQLRSPYLERAQEMP
ncbi:hypothetical protein FACS1894130_06890 [Spirochaetia bacterium]|nr:hypothetical protein FACS1894130_06890 [Spirochaetia bacterium]